MNDLRKDLKERLLGDIRSGNLAMRPRARVILRRVFFILLVATLALALLMLVSFIVFGLRVSGVWFAPIFGAHGWGVFLGALPWLALTSAIALAFCLEAVLRRYRFAYRLPLFVLFLLIGLGLILGGLILHRTRIHERLLRAADEGRLPLGNDVYRGMHRARPSGVHVGVVVATTTSGVVIRDWDEREFPIRYASSTLFRSAINVGDTVMILGPRGTSSVRALGVRTIDSELGPSRPMMNSRPLRRSF